MSLWQCSKVLSNISGRESSHSPLLQWKVIDHRPQQCFFNRWYCLIKIFPESGFILVEDIKLVNFPQLEIWATCHLFFTCNFPPPSQISELLQFQCLIATCTRNEMKFLLAEASHAHYTQEHYKYTINNITTHYQFYQETRPQQCKPKYIYNLIQSP